MEIMYTDYKHYRFKTNKITGLYGDVLDLLKVNVDVQGITYDDEWTVKRFLNGYKFKINPRIESILNYLGLDNNLLKVKLKDLSKTDFKYILLSYLLINNKNIIIFDYFEVGLSHKEQKRLIRIMRNLKKDGFTIIIISKDLVFLSQIVDTIQVVKNEELIYNGEMSDLFANEIDFTYEPEIIKFINLANRKGANLNYTLDSRELLKDIYRSVS